MLGRGVPTISGCENQHGLSPDVMGATETPGIFLEEPGTELLPHNTYPKFQRGDRSLQSARDIRGKLNCLASGGGLVGQLPKY